jgi:RNA polymerase sigma-70 factor (ECF subfamily)
MARAATAGDVEAVGRLYDALVGPIYRYVAVRLRRREDAEDVTQLVFERIVGALPRYRHDGKPFAAWAFRIARNAVIDHQRRLRPTERLGAIAEPRDGLELEALSLRDEEIRELRAAMSRLTPDQREALALRYAAGLSAEEAAQIMGRQAGTIRGLTFRAIESLRRHLTRGSDR